MVVVCLVVFVPLEAGLNPIEKSGLSWLVFILPLVPLLFQEHLAQQCSVPTSHGHFSVATPCIISAASG